MTLKGLWKMNDKMILPKKDILVVCLCAVLLTLTLGAIGNRGRHHAQMIICGANLKHLTTASLMYANDNDGKLFEYSLSEGLWITQLAEYSGKDEARYCPSTIINKAIDPSTAFSFGSSKQSWVWNWSGMEEPEHGSYSFNFWFYSTSPPPTDTRYFQSIANVNSPSMTPIFADSIWVDGGVSDTDICPANFNLEGNPNNGGRMSMHLMNRHGPHINIGFADGHQQAVELGALWSLKWYNDFITVPWMDRTDGTPIYR